MSEFLRIFAALFALYMQQWFHTIPNPIPIVLPPTATATATAVPPTATLTATVTEAPTATATRTATATASATNTITATATPTFTPTPTRPPAASDPLGYDVVGVPPAQKLPAALLIYPLVRASASQETRVEMMNLTSAPVSVQCFYVHSGNCSEIGFFIRLTPNQPISWLASTGYNGSGQRLAPPFSGDGELKCVVNASSPALSSHNALQGRALLTDSGQTMGYSAIAFRRLSPGYFTGSVSLDGVTYEQCPDRLDFHALMSTGTPDSELVLVPCTEDLVTQAPSTANVQLAVVNELEQRFSGATSVSCFNRIPFSSVAALRRSTVGTDTAQVLVRGIDVPVVGLVIERFSVPGSGAVSTSINEPYLEGGRSAGVNLP